MAYHPATAQELVTAIKAQRVAVVKWGASWCRPCQLIGPVFDTWAQTQAGRAAFISAEADDDELEDLASAYNVKSLPTFQVFVDGKLVDSWVGASETMLADKVKHYLT